jgi:hypothetical protein
VMQPGDMPGFKPSTVPAPVVGGRSSGEVVEKTTPGYPTTNLPNSTNPEQVVRTDAVAPAPLTPVRR